MKRDKRERKINDMIKPPRNLYGHKKLLVYQKAEDLQKATSHLTSLFPPLKTHYSLADQMNRSARSVKQNVVEGWKRNSTREYYEFLGYAIASNAEVEEDCNDIWRGIYPKLMGIKGLMGERGEEGLMGERRELDIEKIPFYPLDAHLAPVIQLKLRAKELNFLLDRLQQSLVDKMNNEQTLSIKDKLNIRRQQEIGAKHWYENMLKEHGFIRLENGRVVRKKE